MKQRFRPTLATAHSNVNSKKSIDLCGLNVHSLKISKTKPISNRSSKDFLTCDTHEDKKKLIPASKLNWQWKLMRIKLTNGAYSWARIKCFTAPRIINQRVLLGDPSTSRSSQKFNKKSKETRFPQTPLSSKRSLPKKTRPIYPKTSYKKCYRVEIKPVKIKVRNETTNVNDTLTVSSDVCGKQIRSKVLDKKGSRNVATIASNKKGKNFTKTKELNIIDSDLIDIIKWQNGLGALPETENHRTNFKEPISNQNSSKGWGNNDKTFEKQVNSLDCSNDELNNILDDLLNFNNTDTKCDAFLREGKAQLAKSTELAETNSITNDVESTLNETRLGYNTKTAEDHDGVLWEFNALMSLNTPYEDY